MVHLTCVCKCRGRKGLIYNRVDEKCLANGLQLGPRVCAAHLQGWIVVKDVVAQFLQLGFRICGGELSSIFDFFPNLHINLLQHRSEKV